MKRISSSNRWLAVCGIGLAMVVGCTRHGLQARATDASASPSGPEVQDALVRDLPTDPSVEAWEAPEDRMEDLPIEVQPEAGRETAQEAEREAGPETSPERSLEVGAELGVEAGAEAGPDAGSEARPPACAASSKDARVLAKLYEESFTSGLAISGDTLFVGMESPGGTTGSIVAVSLSTGAQKTFSVGTNIATQLVAGPGALFYSPGKIRKDDAGVYHYEYTDVARLDLTSGKASIVDSSSGSTTAGVGSVVGNAKGDVFWSILADVPAHFVIKRWKEATQTPETVMGWSQSWSPSVDEDHFYWSELTSSLQVVFRSAPTAGGEVTQLYQSPSTFPDTPTLAAVDDQRLYYYFRDPAPGIMAMPKDGGEGQTVVPDASPLVLASHTIDESHLYWTDQNDQATLRRVPKSGNGNIEIFWSADSQWISDIVVDDCNVYWAKYNPPEILVRAK